MLEDRLDYFFMFFRENVVIKVLLYEEVIINYEVKNVGEKVF